MSRKFKQPDYIATPNISINLGEAIPTNHLARFVVDIVAELDISAIYKRYAVRGGEAIAPECVISAAVLWLLNREVQFAENRESYV